jgi:hypothetical protein
MRGFNRKNITYEVRFKTLLLGSLDEDIKAQLSCCNTPLSVDRRSFSPARKRQALSTATKRIAVMLLRSASHRAESRLLRIMEGTAGAKRAECSPMGGVD